MFYTIQHIHYTLIEYLKIAKMPSSLRLKYETKRFRQPDYAFVPLALSENERNGGGFACYIRRRRREFSSLPTDSSRFRLAVKGIPAATCSSKPSLERTNKPTMGSGSLGCDEIQLFARVHSCGGLAGMRALPNRSLEPQD